MGMELKEPRAANFIRGQFSKITPNLTVMCWLKFT